MTAADIDTRDLFGRAATWNGPVFDQGFPDPTLLKDGNVWWAYATSGKGGHIPTATSNDGKSWTFANIDAMPDVGPWIDSRDRGIWAPSVFKNSAGTYVMYCKLYHVWASPISEIVLTPQRCSLR